MATISNRFFVTAIDDGSTLHGNLVSNIALSQAWNGTSAVPDWTVSTNQPTITLTLETGNLPAAAANIVDAVWYYNGNVITFSGSSTTDTTGTFVKGNDQATGMPNLKIIKNLATAGAGGQPNLDNDIIEFKAKYQVSGSAQIPFQAAIPVRITQITANDFLGTITFDGGIANITEKGQFLLLDEILYGGTDGAAIATSSYSVKWFVNNTEITSTSASPDPAHSYVETLNDGHKRLHLYEGDVTDYATIRCQFTKDARIVYNAYVGVDDMVDVEFMYIQHDGTNANAASLRQDEYVKFSIWVGKKDNPNVDTSWTTFKVQLLDGNGDVMTQTNLPGDGTHYVPDPDTGDTEYWRTLTVTNSVAELYIGYATVNTYAKKNLTGIVMAS